MNTLNKALLTASMGLALSLGTGQAQAFALNLAGEGPVSIKFDFYSAECNSVTSNSCYGNDAVDNSANIPRGTAPSDGYLNETTFGLGRVSSIRNEPGSFPTVWSDGDGGEQIVLFVYGVADKTITPVAGKFDIVNVGCDDGGAAGGCDQKIHLDAYVLTNAQFKGFTGPTGFKTADRIGFDVFTGVTDVGQLLFKSEFTQGARGIEPGADLVQNVDATTLPTTGSGGWLADCVAGPGCAWFDSNGQQNGSDFFGQFTLNVAAPALQDNGWIGFNNDPILTTALPEPGILPLFGGGLLGLGFARRLAKRRG